MPLIIAALLLSGLRPHVAAAQSQNQTVYQPISSPERFTWFAKSTVGAKSLAAGAFSSAWNTALDIPKEYGPHWEGFGKRYGMRLTGVATGNAIEAGLGRIWGEDPRYFRSTESRAVLRVRHAVAMVFIAPRADGHRMPAFARYSGIVGNNFLSNTWRVSSESTVSAAVSRSAVGFAGRFASNLFDEFWHDIHDKLRKKR